VNQTEPMIDHLVLATTDVPATADAVHREWGVRLSPGGAHVGRGTRNELTGLGGSTYLEVVGPDLAQPDPPFPRPFGVDTLSSARLVAWCARPTRPLPEVLAAIAAHGIDLGDSTEMSRARPDGVLLHWLLTMPLLDAPHGGALPFLIDWLDSPHPTIDLPHEATLLALHLTHPSPDLLRTVLAEVWPTDLITVEPGPPGLTAAIRTPNGEISL
jgi:Glyoxalase-like domain